MPSPQLLRLGMTRKAQPFLILLNHGIKKMTSKQPAGVCQKNNAKRQEIINQTISNIKNGILLPGSKMPTLRNLAEILECNKNTIFKAYKEMEEKGIIKSDGRSGYCVAQIAISHGI
jgi:DNA-binding GntR family transcriptional regulator